MILTINENRAVIQTRLTPKMSVILPSLEGRRKWLTGGGLSFEPTGHNLAVLRGAYPDLEVHTSVEAENTVVHADFESLGSNPTYQSKTASYDHQKRAFEKAISQRNFGLFMEQGTGKTKVAIDLAATRFCAGEITGLLIVAPKGVHRQWIESQIPQHCGIATRCQFWPFSAAKNLDPSPESMAVFSINIDGIKTGKGHDAVDEFISMHKGRILMVMDESHLIKNVSSQRWKAADKFGKRVAYRLIMTGTPIAKDLSDEWSQLKWLDESIIGIRYLASFRNEYCIMGGYEGREVLSHKNVDRFKQKVEKFTFRATKEEIGILPKSYDHWNFDLSKPQKDMIKSLKKDLQAQIESGQITTASNAALKLMRIQQVSNGFVVDEDENIHSIFKDPKENPRIAALIEFLSSKEGKIIIWCRFIQDILMVKEVLGEQAVFYYGAVSDNDRQKAVKDFLSETGPRFFVANPATGGTGLNLQGSCQSVVYFSNSENSIERWQSEDRTHRIGTVGSVVYTDLIAKGSMDLKILSNLRRKKGISDMALGDIQFWLQQDWDKEEALSEINSGNF